MTTPSKPSHNLYLQLNSNLKEKSSPLLSSSRPNSKRILSSKILTRQNSSRNDKVEKKLYLENINMKNKINSDLLFKLTSTFKSYNFSSDKKDTKIESNLFNIGAKRSLLLRKKMNKVRNLIQDFDNQFSINFDLKNYNKENALKKEENKEKYIKEESYSDFDFDLNKINESTKVIDNGDKILTNKKNFFKEMKKGKIYLKEEKNIENKIIKDNKIIGLYDAFKYYELLYNYKYFITEKDIERLRFNILNKKEKKNLDNFLKSSTLILDKYKEQCEKCKNDKIKNKKRYKNNINIHIYNKNRSNNNLNIFKTELNFSNDNNSKKTLKRAFSGYSSSYNSKSKLYLTRPTTASTNNFLKQKSNNNPNLKSNKNIELNLSNISSSNNDIIKPEKKIKTKKPQNILLIKRKIESLSSNISSKAKELKLELEETYKNIMKEIEDEKKPVKKVKKKMNINIEKIRTDLNLKRRGGGIDENKLIMDNVDKLYKSLPKSHVNLMRSIAKIIINEERRKNKPTIYDDTYDNKKFKEKFKKEMFKAAYKMKEIRKTLNKNKRDKPLDEKMRRLLKNDKFIFFDLKSLKDEINKNKVIRGEIITN